MWSGKVGGVIGGMLKSSSPKPPTGNDCRENRKRKKKKKKELKTAPKVLKTVINLFFFTLFFSHTLYRSGIKFGTTKI